LPFVLCQGKYAFQVDELKKYTFVNFSRRPYRVAPSFPDDTPFTPAEWVDFLELLRSTPCSEKDSLPQKFWDIFYSRVSRSEPPASENAELITMSNDGAADFNARCQAELDQKCFEFTAYSDAKQGSEPTDAEITAFLKERALPRTLTVCAGSKVILRKSDKAKDLHKGTLMRVHESVSAKFSNKPISELPLALSTGGRYCLRPSRLEMRPGVFVVVYEANLAWAMTAHLSQSQQRHVWHVSLRQEFMDGALTFAGGQVTFTVKQTALFFLRLSLCLSVSLSLYIYIFVLSLVSFVLIFFYIC
jgi:hypothetical protein